MDENTGPGPAPGEPTQHDFKVDAVGLVSRTFGVWGRRLLSYVAISSITAVGLALLELVFFYLVFGTDGLTLYGTIPTSVSDFIVSLLTPGGLVAFTAVVVVLLVVGIVFNAIVVGAITKHAMDNYGSPSSGAVGASLSFAFGRLPTLVGSMIVVDLMMGLFLAPLLYMLNLLVVSGMDILVIESLAVPFFLLVIICIPAYFYIALRLLPYVAVVIGEDLSIVGSIKKAFALTSHHFWHVFGGYLLLVIVTIILDIVISLFVSLLSLSDLFTSLVIGIVSAAIVTPLLYVFQAILYKDLLARGAVESQQQLW